MGTVGDRAGGMGLAGIGTNSSRRREGEESYRTGGWRVGEGRAGRQSHRSGGDGEWQSRLGGDA